MKRDLSGFNGYEVVTIAIALLSGATRRVHTEEIAERAAQLAPEKFSWQMEKYRQRDWPDKFLVKCALVDAKKAKYGQLVDGQSDADLSKDGWRLTSAGAEWFEELPVDLKQESDKQETTGLPRREAKRFVSRVTKEPLYRRYLKEGSLQSANSYELTDLLNTSPDASVQIIVTKFQRLLVSAQLAGDEAVLRFLEECICTFPALLGEFAPEDRREVGE